MKITSVNYLKTGKNIKIVLGTSLPAFKVRLKTKGKTYSDAFNAEEPFDRKTHVFYIPEKDISFPSTAELIFCLFKRSKRDYTKKFRLEANSFADEKELLAEYDHGIRIIKEEPENLFTGVSFTKFICEDSEKNPVIFSLIKTDLKSSSLYIGTPDDGYESKKVKATIPDMIASAEKNGREVLAGVNADFFDIFGDYHPSGLCVKNGKVVANENSFRPFIGLKKDGAAVITDITESPDITGQLLHAAAGLQMIVKDGKIFDYAPLEPFSFVRHPRTAAGLTKDGCVLLLEVDGRIPSHSNGATLVDLAKFLIALGADRAINLDGGGSSAVYTILGGEHSLRTVPADLFRPNDMLIRKDYNAVFVIKDEQKDPF
ncbi:MAG: phosphodiester glycosidase family protein [Oscillospiraceae bacterium]|nr:phosphodiester glycosidase family protein [Oscillospiraceae bacterium]